MNFRREWAMPNSETFKVPPIMRWVTRYYSRSYRSIDPFARNNTWATHTNDLNPATTAQHHIDAVDFLLMLGEQGIQADLIILDPPYSPRQIQECYQGIGKPVIMRDTQTANLYSRMRDAAAPLIGPKGIVLSFGWNSVGMGKKHGFKIDEMLLVCHGGAHNDTICIAETRI